MTIAFTGGGTGGHFYPLIAIAEAINDLTREERLVEPKLYYLAPTSFDEQALFENRIGYIRIPAGKVRRYASLANVTDSFVTLVGTLAAVITLFRIYPDVVVSKGGYASVPVVLAARILRIPIVIHESDAKPGRANLMASKFATKIAVSFDSAVQYFPKKAQARVARTGVPIRKALTRTESEGAAQFLGLEAGIPTILILGGSQGSQKINEAIVSALPEFVSFANVIHQTGVKLFKDVSGVAKVALGASPSASRYHPFDYLSETALQRAAGAAALVISRAGATAIAEIGLWKKPAILIPIPESVSHDQRTNAYAFARTGAAVVIEEENLTPHLLAAEARRIVTDPALATAMGAKAAGFTDPDAARVLASAILSIALTHES
jgi:UDP-N-acetylglucosamine--N-acetylmuramyl-(pentapeptide) pyrophosphoryl-undecaprenol N-acetylglucosamine transferase